MTIEQLYNKLVEMDIPKDRYYLRGLYGSTNDNDKIALSINRGKYFTEYEVYYKEKTEKNSMKIFTSETEACDYILQKFQTP